MKNIQLLIQGKKRALPFNEHFTHLAKINESVNRGALGSYRRRGYTYVDVPAIVGITGACENIDTLFKIQNRLDLPLFFTQTGQLALEQSLQSFPAVCTVIYSARDEEAEDRRHLRQFRLTEEEFDSTTIGMSRETYDEERMFEALLSNIQKTIQAMIRRVLRDNGSVLRNVYKRDISKLEAAAKKRFLRITYEDAVTLLNKNGFPNVSFGDDLKADHEAKIVALVNRRGPPSRKASNGQGGELPVFITHYPKEIKFFNMKVAHSDSRVCLSADLIFPYSGEGVGSAVREHVFERLKARLVTSVMYKLHVERGGKYEDFAWYLDIMKNKSTNPHAGYGIGNERVLQYIFGASDTRHVSLFSLLNRQTGDWSRKRYGQAGIIAGSKKHVLLSIGEATNKKYLLPYVKKLSAKQQFVLYATEKTYNFLKQNGVNVSLVYKISQIGKTPNIGDLMSRRVFDIVINIPTRKRVKTGPEFTDGMLIRKGAVDMGITLITDPEVAAMTMENLGK